MTDIKRILDLKKIISQKSVFLLGPRQTGKSTFVKNHLNAKFNYNLLLRDVYSSLLRDPTRIRRETGEAKRGDLVVIDEIQMMPELLNEVQHLITAQGLRFILTGSSARKLKRAGTNLLGGRASRIYFHPLIYSEIGKKQFDLLRALNIGLLPSIYLSENASQDLQDYVGIYLKEEIAAEGYARNLPAFSRFLEIAAISNGQMINFSKMANDAQVSPSVCYEYFQVLKDTLIALELPCWMLTKKRKAYSTSKFYFFDQGVTRSLQGRNRLTRNDSDFGNCFESFLFHELQTYTDYKRLAPLHYWHSKSQFEVDFILNEDVAIEVKATRNPSSSDFKGLNALAEEKLLRKNILVCQATKSQKFGKNMEAIPWEDFLDRLWNDLLTK